uniref:Uncharacterized protein n=1 Tax=Glossina palpalis gambiensis TaxID=67801 RepID=A0A1B0BYQ0_9MUSC
MKRNTSTIKPLAPRPFNDSDMIFGNCGSLVDGVSDDTKMESQRDIYQRASDDLAEVGLTRIHLSIHLTSIYDHSIFEAFSKVVQKLIPQLSTLENLLNIFISNSGIEKAFLFDVVSKIYIATYCSPVDIQSYELCCDMIDVVIYLSNIYSSRIVRLSPNMMDNLLALFESTKFFFRRVSSLAAFSRAKSLLMVLAACLHISSSAYHTYEVRAVWADPASSFLKASLTVCNVLITRGTVTVQFNSTLSPRAILLMV